MGPWVFRIFSLLALILLGGALAFNYYRDNERDAALDDLSVSFLRPETTQTVEKSIYMVLEDGAFLGTAWVADNRCGVLVTNAHVAEEFDPKKSNLSVRSATTQAEFKVMRAEFHAARPAFEQVVDQFGPLTAPKGPNEVSGSVPIAPSYDVALLHVAEACDATLAEKIGPALPIASPAELKTLRPGDPIAEVSFQGVGTPTDWMQDETMLTRVDTGIIRALTSFIPVRNGLQGDHVAENQMILSILPSTEGSSGSPVVNVNGHVIGLMTGYFGVSLGNGERWITRADIISELLSHTDKERVQSHYMPMWQTELKQYQTEEESLKKRLAKLVDKFAKDRKQTPNITTVRGFSAEFGADVPKYTVKFTPTRGANEQSFTFGQKGRYFRTTIQLDPKQNHMIGMLDYDLEAPYNWCEVSLAIRDTGAAQFLPARVSRAPRLVVLKNGRTTSDFDVVFYRQNYLKGSGSTNYPCSATSTHFSYVVVSWTETGPKPPEQILDTFKSAATSLFDVRNWGILRSASGPEMPERGFADRP